MGRAGSSRGLSMGPYMLVSLCVSVIWSLLLIRTPALWDEDPSHSDFVLTSSSPLFLKIKNILFLYLLFPSFILLVWVIIAVHGPPLVLASRAILPWSCMGSSSQWLLLLRRMSFRDASFGSCPTACGNSLDPGSNPCPLHWPAGS